MWVIPTAVFWSSVAAVGYSYLGYPVAIKLMSKLFQKPVVKKDIAPTVSVVLAAHNEKNSICAKLDNLLNMDYPADKLQIVVVDDGSTDGMGALLKPYADHEQVEVLALDEAGGKPAALNYGMTAATGDVVVFCDARQRVDEQAIKALASCFADGAVGAVSGELEMAGEKGPGFYWKYEKFIRMAEAKVDSVPGATGALFAIRRALFEPIPKDALLDDVFTPMQIILKGYRVIFEPGAKVYDIEAESDDEFRRKARTLAGNFQILGQLPQILNPFKNRIFWQYASHKIMRLVCPFALIGLLGTNVVLVATFAPGWPFYVFSLGGQLLCYGLAIHGAMAKEKAGKLSRLAHTFTMLNSAAVVGLKRYLSGDFSWTSSKKV